MCLFVASLALCVCGSVQGGGHSRSPSVASLTVETALGSFDFLNTSDWEEEEEEKKSDRRRINSRLVWTTEMMHSEY